MEYLQIDVYDLTVFDTENKQAVHFDKLRDVRLDYKGDHYELTVRNALLHAEYLKFVGKERILTDYEKSLGGKKTTVSIREDDGKECKLIAKSKLYDPDTNKVASDIIIEIPRAFTALKPSLSGENGVAFETVANFKIYSDMNVNEGEYFKIHI